MRIRKLLLIHSGRSTRALIKKYIYSELSDTEIAEADSGQSALAQITSGRFDVLISAEYLDDMGLDVFASKLAFMKPNGRVPLIVISDSESDQAREDLVQQGFSYVVQTRIRPADLIKQIDIVCDPRKWRKDARFHIPNATAVIDTPLQKMEAALINISMGGVFLELCTQDPTALMNGGLSLTLQIPLPGSTAQIDGLKTKLLRVETVDWTKGHLPRTMRATFIFVNLSPNAQGKLEELVQMAKEEKLSATEVID